MFDVEERDSCVSVKKGELEGMVELIEGGTKYLIVIPFISLIVLQDRSPALCEKRQVFLKITQGLIS